MSFTIHDSGIPCPRCQTEEAVHLFVRAERTGAPYHGYNVTDSGSAPCVECGYRLTSAEEDAAVLAAYGDWEPPSADDLADMRAGW